MEAIAGHDPLDATSIPEPFPDLRAALGRGVEGLRIGLVEELLGGEGGFQPEVLARTREAADALGRRRRRRSTWCRCRLRPSACPPTT